MQSVWFYIHLYKRPKDTFENTQQEIVKQVIWGNIWKKHSGEKTNKCNQFEFASASSGNLRKAIKAHGGEKKHKCNSVNMILLMQSIWGLN